MRQGREAGLTPGEGAGRSRLLDSTLDIYWWKTPATRGGREIPALTAAVDRDRHSSLPAISMHDLIDLVEKGGYPS